MANSVPSFNSFPSPPPSPSHHPRLIPSFDSFPDTQQHPSRRTSPRNHPKNTKTTPIHENLTTSITDQVDHFLNSLSHHIHSDLDLVSKSSHPFEQIIPSHSDKETLGHTNLAKKSHIKSDRKSTKKKHAKKQSSPPLSGPSKNPIGQLQSTKISTGRTGFTIDLREDTFNLLHGRPDRGKVPRYRRAAAGRVLGLDPHLRISLSTAYRGDGLHLSLERSSKAISISDPAVLHLLNDKNLKRISLLRPSNVEKRNVHHPSAPFIPLVESDHSTSQRSSHDLNKTQQHVINLYEDSESEQEDSIDFVPPELDGGESFLDQLNQRKGTLEKRTREHPDDVEAWLALVSLQDEMKELGLVGLRAQVTEVDQDAIRRHMQGTSDVKISYLKQALREASNQTNESLLLAYMKAYCDQPDVDLAKEWRKILEAHPTVTGLWIAYIDWKQTEATSMNILEMVEVYEELIDRLVRRSEDLSLPERERNSYEQSIVYLFHRCCVMLKQSGYAERAVAAFQAIIEINFFSPHRNSHSLNELIEDFEAFWDSEAPRIGESGAMGWLNMKSEWESCCNLPIEFKENDHSSMQEKFDTWGIQEIKARRPLRTTDPQDDEDPFGCVLFDDLRNLLFLVSTEDSRQALLYSFLSFIGLSIPPPDIHTNVPFFTDPFLSTELIDLPERQSTFWPNSETKPSFDVYGPTERLSGIKKPQMIPFRIFPFDIRQFFADPSRWFVNFSPPTESIELIRNSFQALRTSPQLKQDIYFKLCQLSFEARIDVSVAVKLAKQYLSTDQKNLVLWDAYARLCLLHGKQKQARDVYVKVLQMVNDGTEGLMSIWYSWAEMEFQLGHFQLVISILARALHCLDESPSALLQDITKARSPAMLLRVRRTFTGKIAGLFCHDLPLSLLRCRVSAVVAFGTFQYITEGFQAGCEVYENSLKAISDLNSLAEEEELWMNYSRLIYHQIKGNYQSFKPIKIRSILERAIIKFPNNSIFLSLFAYNESKMKIENHTRRLINSILLNHKKTSNLNVNSWLFAIWLELNINLNSFNQAVVRSLFEGALLNQRSCLQIWLLYIEFEIRNDNFLRAKSLITRSLAICPWAKQLYLIPFSIKLKGGYKNEMELIKELKRMLKLMDEKCIRIKDRLFIFQQIEKFEFDLLNSTDNDHHDDDPQELIEQVEFDQRIKLLPY